MAQEGTQMSSEIKNTQLTRVGYTYQDFICIKLLVDWYHDPYKYEWVAVEGATTEKDDLSSLDDVVAFDKNGKYTLLQVKFTIDPSREDLKLDFDWLLKKKNSGTSLIQKWYRDVKKYADKGTLGLAALKTNRIPDEELALCLRDQKIDINLIPKIRLDQIAEQLGSSEAANLFLEEFFFEHSQCEIKDLEEKLFNSIVPMHATTEGWYRFLKTVQHWATHKNQPPPNGQIFLSHLVELFDSGIGRSLSQFFEVPDGYIPPSEKFHSEIILITKNPGGWVVSGLPGMGKSTYLSFLTNELLKTKTVVIRHHYSLSAQSIVDRTSFPNVARSLQHQLKAYFPEIFEQREYNPDELDKWIVTAQRELAVRQSTLVVVIDGLDHVSREHKEITQLEHLVNRLISLKDKVCIIFGTQPVSDAQLPPRLTAEISRTEKWISLPAMDLQSIKSMAESLERAGKISINFSANKEATFADISEALLKVSGGYPLHIHYSLHNLSMQGKSISTYEIEKLPTCPDGDIHTYYTKLWSSLSETARQVLLLIASAEFPWPDKSSIGWCFENTLVFTEAYSKIQHLIAQRRSGVFPFHSSILVFLRGREEFIDASKDLLNTIRAWVESAAPQYWKWGWKWIVEANLGNPTHLITGITRDWMVQSFCDGYPPAHIEHIIAAAERSALSQGLYVDLVKLRMLKIRLINGPDFQVREYAQFVRCALTWSEVQYGLQWSADNLRTLSERELPVIGVLFRRIDENVSDECLMEIMRRIDFYAHIDGGDNNKIISLIDGAIDVFCDRESPNIKQITEFLERIQDNEIYFTKVFERLIEAGNAQAILEFRIERIPEKVIPDYWDYFVIACAILEICITERPELQQISTSPLGLISLITNGRKVTQIVKPEDSRTSDEKWQITASYLYDFFFIKLAEQLQHSSDISLDHHHTKLDAKGFAEKALATLEWAAYKLASNLKAGLVTQAFELHHLISTSGLPRQRSHDYELNQSEFALEHALTKISVHLHLLLSREKIAPITSSSLEMLTENSWWFAEGWLRSAAHLIPGRIAQDFVDTQIIEHLADLKTQRTDTSTLANHSLDLACLALSLNRKEIGRKCLEFTGHQILGYGYRKDTTFSEVFDAIQYCSDQGVGNVPDWLRRVAPFVNDVFDFSEREIRHIPAWYLKLLGKHAPERLVDEYDYHLKQNNWNILPQIIEQYVNHCDLTQRADFALLRCLSTSECISALEERAPVDDRFQFLVEEQHRLLGGVPPRSPERQSAVKEDYTVDISLSKYRPEELELLCKEINSGRNAFHAEDYMVRWISHWEAEREGLKMIESYERLWIAEREFPYCIRQSLGVIFSLCHKLQGKKAAYKWAVRDIRSNSHWARWSGTNSEMALKKYGKIYAAQWEELLRDTISGGANGHKSNEWIIVPSHQLVSYLLSAGQLEMAAKITEVMLASLEAEISTLPLSQSHWYSEPITSVQIGSRLLLLNYKWPDRFMRRRCAEQIADLIEADDSFRELYLEHLSKLKYEVEISDFLCILTMIESTPFSLQELVAAIKYPCLLSDEILFRLGFSHKHSEPQTLFSNLSQNDYRYSERFEKSKNGIAPIYYAPIERLGEILSYPLHQHLAAEWDLITQRRQFLYFNHHEFSSGFFYPQDHVGCSLSTEAEAVIASAYVRTISFAMHRFKLPLECIESQLEGFFPFTQSLARFSPTSSPVGWPKLKNISEKDELPSHEDLDSYMASLSSNEQITIFANGPLLREPHGVNCDLEILTVYMDDCCLGNPEALYKAARRIANSPNDGPHPLATRCYSEVIGRFEVDFLLRGLFEPTFLVGGPSSEVQYLINEIRYVSNVGTYASYKYWTNSWYPVWYDGLGPALGTYLEVPRAIINTMKAGSAGSYYLIGKLTTIDKRGFSNENKISEIYGVKKI